MLQTKLSVLNLSAPCTRICWRNIQMRTFDFKQCEPKHCTRDFVSPQWVLASRSAWRKHIMNLLIIMIMVTIYQKKLIEIHDHSDMVIRLRFEWGIAMPFAHSIYTIFFHTVLHTSIHTHSPNFNTALFLWCVNNLQYFT